MTIGADTQDIVKTVQLYLDGLYEGNTEKLRESFHPVACLQSVSGDKVANLPLDEWCALVEKRPSPKSQNFDRGHERILKIDLTLPNCASVILNCAVPGRLFTDQLGLLKSEGRWQVVNKIFESQSLG